VGVDVGVEVEVGVGVDVGVEVEVGVGVDVGVEVGVDVGVEVEVGVGVGTGVDGMQLDRTALPAVIAPSRRKSRRENRALPLFHLMA